MGYLLDANTLIDADRRFYKFCFMPGFWDWVERGFQFGTLLSIDLVYEEILASDSREANTHLREWTKRNRGFFREIDGDTNETVVHLLQLLKEKESRGAPQYASAAIRSFSDGADPYLIAYAKTHGHAVVTNEQSAPRSAKVVKIPDACKLLGVDSISLFDLLAIEQPKFVLAENKPA